MPLPHERRKEPHEEVMELIDRRFDQLMSEIEELKRRLRAE